MLNKVLSYLILPVDAEQLWRAPEIIREKNSEVHLGSSEADVYAFGIILQEIVFRAMPFGLDTNNVLTPKGE